MNDDATRALLAESHWVQRLARQLVRSEDLAEDVCQETMVAALHSPAGKDRPWLLRVARNVAVSLLRREHRRTAVEHAAATDRTATAAGELAAQAELQRAAVGALLELDEPYRETMLLRYMKGLPVPAVARRMGVPVETVRTRIKRALARLRRRLDSLHDGDRRAWCLVLLPSIRTSSPGTVTGGAGNAMGHASGGAAARVAEITGVLIMTTKGKLAAVAAFCCVLLAALWMLQGSSERYAPLHDAAPGTGSPVAVRADTGESNAGEPARRTALSREPVAERKLGSLSVRVIWAEDGTPAAGVLLEVGTLRRSEAGNFMRVGDVLFDATCAMTDARGTLQLADMKPGPVYVECQWGFPFPGFGEKRATIEAGQEADVQLRIPPGIDVDGVVVDRAANPVAGADILIESWNPAWGHPVAKTDGHGRFHLRSLGGDACRVGARAPGHAPSPMYTVSKAKGADQEIRIVLGEPGGALHGRVMGLHRDPVPNAVIEIMDVPRQMIELPEGRSARSAAPIRVRTDAEGCFLAEGLAPGKAAVAVRARGLAPWTGTADIWAGGSSELAVNLLAGVALTGTARDGNGAALDEVLVLAGDWRTLAFQRTMTDATGKYRLEGLGPGELKVEAGAGERGKVEAELVAVAGQTLQWHPVISKGLVLRGRVVDEDGKPVKGAVTATLAFGLDGKLLWHANDWTDEDGRFELRNCEPGRKLRIAVQPSPVHVETVVYVEPDGQDLVIRVPRAAAPTAQVTGRLSGPDGEPVTEGKLYLADRQGGTSRRHLDPEPTTGRFTAGPFPPGEYRACIHAADHWVLRTAWRTLAPSETWDLGVLRLQRPGFLQVTLAGEVGLLPRKGSFWILDSAKEYLQTVRIREGKADRSKPLAAGSYHLQVVDEELACALHEFEIHAGRDTDLEVPLAKGVPVVLNFVFQTDVGVVTPRRTPWETVDVEIRDSDERIILARSRSHDRPTLAFAARPGKYRVVATAGNGKRAEVPLTVSDRPADPVRVVLR